jgi:hypothetical protein
MTEPVTHREIALLAELFKAGNDRLSGQIEGLRAHMDDALGRGVARMDRMDAENKGREAAVNQEFELLKARVGDLETDRKLVRMALAATWGLFGTGIVAALGWLIKVAWNAAIAGAVG